MDKIGSIIETTDKFGNVTKEEFFTYSEEEQEQNEINRKHAKLIYDPGYVIFRFPLLDNGFTYMEVALFGFIEFYLHNRKSIFYFTNEQLSQIMRCSIKTIKNALKKMRDHGLIRCTHKARVTGGTWRKIQLSTNPQSLYTSGVKCSPSARGKRLPTNKNKYKKNKVLLLED